MRQWLKALMVLSFVFFSSKSVAQEICASTPESYAAAKRAIADVAAASQPRNVQWSNQGTPLPGLEQFRRYFANPPSTFAQTPPLAKPEKETRFSWWGFGHDELHAKDEDDPESKSVIDELEERYGIGGCCNGVRSGECRISKFEEELNPLTGQMRKQVIVDGEACDVTGGTKFAALHSFKRPGFIVVCAAKTYRSSAYTSAKSTCSTYCIGTAGGF